MKTSTSKIKIAAIVIVTIIAVRMFTPKQKIVYQSTPSYVESTKEVAAQTNHQNSNETTTNQQGNLSDEEAAAAALLLLAAMAQESESNSGSSYSENDYDNSSNYDENGLKTSYTSADIHDIVSTQLGESIVYE